MENNKYKQLEEVTLVKSGDFGFSTISTIGNVLFNGHNGAGKTTLQRAILFFYFPSTLKTDFGIGSNKKSFKEYYLPVPDSYIVYKYRNTYGSILAVVHRNEHSKNVKVRFFMFDDMTDLNMKEVFLENGYTRSQEDIFHRLSDYSVDETKTLRGEHNFRLVLLRRSGNEEFDKYTMFESSSELLGQAIKNVFLSSKIKSETLEELLAESVEADESTDGSDGISKISYDGLRGPIETILDLHVNINEANKYRALADDIITTSSKYTIAKEETNKLMLSIRWKADLFEKEKKPTSEKLEKAKSLYTKKEKILEETKKKHSKEYNDELIEIGVIEKQIQNTEESKKRYAESNIVKKMEHLDSIPYLNKKIKSLDDEIALLTEKVSGLTGGLKQKIENEKISFEAFNNKMTGDINQLGKEYAEEKEKVRETNRKIKSSISDHEASSIELLKNKKSDLAWDVKIKEDALKKLKEEEYHSEAYTIKKEHIAGLEEEKKKNNDDIKSLDSQMLSEDKNLEFLEVQKNASLKEINTRKKNALDPMNSKHKELERLTDYSSGSTIGFIMNSDLSSKELLLSTLRNDILLSESIELSIEDAPSLSFCGLKMQNVPLSTYADIEIALEDIQEKIDETNKAFANEISKVKDDIEFEKDDIEKKRKQINKKRSSQITDQNVIKQKLINGKADLLSIEAKDKAEKRDREDKGKDASLKAKQKLEEATTNLEDAETNLKVLLLEEDKKLTEKLEEMKSEYSVRIEGIKNKIGEESKEADERIIDIRKQISQIEKNGAVDVELLEKKKEDRINIQKDVDSYEGFRDEVVKFRVFMENDFSQLKDLQVKFSNKKEMHRANNTKRAAIEVDIVDSVKVLNDNYQEVSSKFTEITKGLSDYIELKNGNAAVYNCEDWNNLDTSVCREHADTYYRDKDMASMINAFSATSSNLFVLLTTVKTQLQKYYRAIPSPDYFSIREAEDYDNEKEVMRSVEDIQRFIEDGYVDDSIKEMMTSFALNIKHFMEKLDDLETKTSNVQRFVNRINIEFEDIKGIDVVKNIEIKKTESSNKILSLMRDIREKYEIYEEKYGLDVLGEGLFAQNTGRAKNLDLSILDIFTDIIDELDNVRGKYLSTKDCFELEFKIDENNNEGRWTKQGDDFGSNGTDVIIKTLIYLTFIGVLKKNERSEGKEDEVIHCILDEIGTLSPEYFEKIIRYANKKGVFLINGMPSEMLSHMYRSHYWLSKVNRDTTVAKRIVHNQGFK